MAGNIIASLLLGIATKADTSGLSKTDRGLQKLGNTAQKVSAKTSLLGKITGGLFGGINIHAIKGAFNEYLQFEKDIGAMKSRFFAITKDEKEAEEEYKYINDLAIQTANNVKSTADSYSIFYASARNALGKEGARGVFEAWTKVGRVLHLNEQQFERVTYALREMSSKGQLYSQDLKMQLGTHVPDAVNIAETAIKNMNKSGINTIEDFQKLTKKKKSRELMGEFLIKFSEEAERRFASPEALKKALLQPDALQQSIMNLGWVFANKFSEAGGRDLIVKILSGTYDLLNSIDYKGLANVLGSIAKGIGSILSFLLKNIKTIIILLQIMIASKMANFMRGALGEVAKSFGIMGVADTFGLAKLGMFGPVGRMISRILFLFGERFGIKLIGGFIGRIVGLLTGPWGIAISLIISFLPQIFSCVRQIWFHFNKGSVADRAREALKGYGVSETQLSSVIDILNKRIKSGQIENEEDLRRIAGYYIGDKKAQEMFTLNDKSQIIIKVEGVGEVLSTDVITTPGKKDGKDKGVVFFNRPKPQVITSGTAIF